MIVSRIKRGDLQKALVIVNKKYAGNVIFNRQPEALNSAGTRARFTLRVKDSRAPGARRTREGRRIPSACWHVHGHYFEALFIINPRARVFSGGRWITATEGNWQDRNIGSIMEPFNHSAACECRDLSSRAAMGYGKEY